MECLQHERVRISQNKTSIECQSFIRICRLDTELITCGGSSRYSQLQCLRVALLAEVQDGHTTGLVWQKRGSNPPLSFITANLTMIGDESSSFVIT